MEDNREKSLYPSSYKSPNLYPTFSKTRMLKGLFGKALKYKKEISKKKEENIGQNEDEQRLGDVPPFSLH